MRSLLFIERLLKVAKSHEDVEFLTIQLFELKKELNRNEKH